MFNACTNGTSFSTGMNSSAYTSLTLYPPCSAETHWLPSVHVPVAGLISSEVSPFECVYSLRYEAPTASCIVPAGNSNRPPFKSARQTFSCVKKLLDAGAPASLSTAIVFGSSRLKRLIGVQLLIGASAVPQWTTPSVPRNEGPVD